MPWNRLRYKNQPRKSMKWLDEPRKLIAIAFFNNNAKNFKSCCAINVLLAKNSKFQTSPKTPYDAYIAIAQIIVEFERKKVAKGSLVYLDYTPFHGFFEAAYLSVCHIWLKTVQFSQKCNEFSGRYLIAIFEKKTDRKKKFSKQQKCYTTSLRISLCAHFA